MALTDQELVKTCLTEVCKKSGYDPAQRLMQRDLEFLCESIDEKTGILISLSTMRRLINGQFGRLPQIATLNAIASFAGYNNWQHFKMSKQDNLHENVDETPAPAAAKTKRPVSYKIIGLAVALLALGFILAYRSLSLKAPGRYDKVLFTARKTTNNDIPNTVVFNYDIDKLEGDSFFIQQSWDVNRRVRIYKNSHTLTDIYYEPGYHNAKLIVNDSIVKTIPVSIPTDRWFFYIKKASPASIPVYIEKAHAAAHGVLALDSMEVVQHGVHVQEDHNYCYTWYPSHYDVSSDNFKLSARIRIKPLKNLSCPRMMLEVFCQHYFMYFITTSPGCTSNSSAQFGDCYLNGKTNDLSGFGADITQWQQFDMVNDHHAVTIYINKKEVFSKKYTSSAGLITGLGFISNGLCEVDSVSFTGAGDKVVYRNDFNE